MRKSRAMLFMLLIVFALGIVADDEVVRAPREASPRGISVVIDSRPEHAEIRLNGKFIGTTPLSYRLPAGAHEIELVRPQFATWVRELTVTDTPTRVVAVLQSKNAAQCSGE